MLRNEPNRLRLLGSATLLLLAMPFGPMAAQQPADTLRICLAPSSVQISAGDANAAVAAVRDAFTSFLTGPSLAVRPLTARLASQAREEARLSSCPYVLLTTLRHQRKKGGPSLLGRAASGAAEGGAWSALGAATGTAARVAAGAAASAASGAREIATYTRSKDQLELTYRLEGADGKALLEKSEKRTASSDGEDLLTPLVERAAEAIVTVAKRAP